MVAVPLTMPTTYQNGTSNITMHGITDDNESGQSSNQNYADSVRSQMDTKNLEAIMQRFFNAVSWREE